MNRNVCSRCSTAYMLAGYSTYRQQGMCHTHRHRPLIPREIPSPLLQGPFADLHSVNLGELNRQLSRMHGQEILTLQNL